MLKALCLCSLLLIIQQLIKDTNISIQIYFLLKSLKHDIFKSCKIGEIFTKYSVKYHLLCFMFIKIQNMFSMLKKQKRIIQFICV